ncbi:thiamine phosphate synthase [Peribacillus kribbensis]|uniref:thiamine phosphate synthase n=1 Tax=Peribacillus kribbensis TaxID=356658 RepID=UPI000423492E|nr:thiamine phosphate synthase [Peribacillus kribbensis]
MDLIAVTDGRHSDKELLSIIIQIKDHVDFVHIREKTKPAGGLFALLHALIESGVPREKIVVNDRLDLALLHKVHGVHLPGLGLPVRAIREQFPHLKIGRSVHSFAEAELAEKEGADYMLYGHIYETHSKKGRMPRGLTEMSLITQSINLPIYAIGGVTPERVNELRQKNLAGIAVMSGIFASENPGEAAKRYFAACKEGHDDSTL